ncbi:MAG: CoA-binding protein [bacterium]
MKKYMLGLKKWAVVGASDNPEKFGYKIFKKLLKHGYEVYPVNPRLKEIEGNKVYKSLTSIPETIEVVDLVVNPLIGKTILEEVKELSIENVWLQPGARSEEIDQIASEFNLNVVKDCVLASLK